MNTEPPPYPQAYPPPAPKRSGATIALVGLVMLLVGAAAGWFLQPQFADDDTVETASVDQPAADATTDAPAASTTTTAPAPTTAAAPVFPTGTWTVSGTVGECELNGGTCTPPTVSTVTWTCDAATCTSDSGRVYQLSGSTITWSGAITDTPLTCDGNAVPTNRDISYTYSPDGTIRGTSKITAPAVPPSCPKPFVQENLYTGTPA